jgi:thioredoxin-related protein
MQMRILPWLVFVLLILVAPLSSGRAGIDRDAAVPPLGNLQLVVMEAEGCIYCTVFRRDVLPSYEESERGKDMPVRFVDVNDVEKTGIELVQPIDILPTFVVVKDNREVGRIPGYVGPEDFFHSINYLLSSSP